MEKGKVYIYLLLFFFLSTKAEINIETLIFTNNRAFSYNKLEGPKFYKIKPISSNDIPNYIKLIVQDNEPKTTDLNLIISYYQDDSTFSNRRQLSTNSSDITIMWLNKEQIKNEFYLSIECGESPCKYNFTILPEDIIRINLGQIYKYYITEQNKEMIFNIKGNLNFESQNRDEEKQFVTVWAKGSKEMNTKLENIKYTKHSKYNAYLIDVKNFLYLDCNIVINGNIGDLITVGAFFCEGKELGRCRIDSFNNEDEYSGFLKKNYLEQNCFNNSLFTLYSFQFILNDYYTQVKYSYEYNYNYICINIPEEFDEIFYSFHKYNNKLILMKPGNIINVNGFQKDDIIGFIPIIVEDYNFVTYKVNSFKKDAKTFIIKCDTYPLCNLDINNTKDITEFERIYDTHFLTLDKKQIDFNHSPINKKQHIIIFSFGSFLSFTYGINALFYTDKTVFGTNIYNNYNDYFFTKKGSINKFYFYNRNSYDTGMISIQKISGKISIKYEGLNNIKTYSYKNMYLYELSKNDKVAMFQITSEKNAIYSIKNQYFTNNIFDYKINGNYIFNINNKQMKFYIFDFYYYDFRREDRIYYILKYLSINPIGCNISLQKEIGYFYNEPETQNLSLSNNFYQNIYRVSTGDKINLIIKNQNNEDTCLVFCSSLFFLKDELSYFDQGIIISDGLAQSFWFNKVYNKFHYFYYHTEKDKDIKIDFNLLNEGQYQINLFLDNNNLSRSYNISSNQTILIDNDSWKDIWKENSYVFILSFTVLSYKENDSYLQIKLHIDDDEDKGSNDEGSNSSSALIVILVIVGLIIILIIIILIIRYRKKKNVIEDMDTITKEGGDTKELLPKKFKD